MANNSDQGRLRLSLAGVPKRTMLILLALGWEQEQMKGGHHGYVEIITELAQNHEAVLERVPKKDLAQLEAQMYARRKGLRTTTREQPRSTKVRDRRAVA